MLAAGTYDEDVTVTDKELTFAGANFGTSGAGSRGAESVIHGRVSVSGSKAVAFNGLEFLADNDTGTIGHGNAALQLHGSGTYTVHNSVFYSDFVGGSVEATAIQLDTSATGTINIESNLFTGSQTAANMNLFGGANWQRGIWSDGAEHQLNITDNSFSNVRSAVNLDGYDDTTHHVSENTFIAAGTGISVGIPVTNTYAGIHDNDFQTVNDDFNFQNLTTIGVDLDLTETHNTSTGGVAPIGGVIQVLGSQVADHITGSAVSDVIFGNGGDDIIDGGGGNDTIDGGAGTGDTYVLSGAWSDYVISRSGNTYTITKGGETDTVTNVENFSFHGHVVSVTGDPDTIVSLAPTITGIVETGTDEDNNPGTVAVSEAASAGTVIATVSAADHNIGADDALTFTLVDGAGNAFTGPFSITKNADGVSATIAVAAALNFDLHSSYGFYVKVTDSAGHSVTQATAVSVIDVNGPPVAPAGNNVDVESGKTEAALADPNAAPLNLALPVDLEGDPITFHLTSIQPSGGNQPGTVLLNGVAVTAATLLSAADMQSLTYLAPVTNDPAPEVVALNFEYTDGVNTPANMQVLVNITPAADDSYAGTAGADRFDGGAGNDTYTIDNVGDVVLEQAGAGIDTVLVGSLTSYTLGANVENLTHTASNSFTGTGNELANVMIGGTGDDKLIGGGGDDTLNGGGGSNTAQYSGNHSDYLVTAHSGQGGVTYTVQDLRNGTPDGTDTLSNIAKLQFADGTVVINGNAGTIRHDFDGNGHSDALLVNDNGSATVWDNGAPGTAHQIAPAGIIANGWHFASTGDFDGNGKSDILWVNDNTGQASIWDDGQIGGAHIISPPGTIANGWHFASTGDFDGNGKADILWVNDNTGQASIWDNGQIGSAHIIAPPGTISGGWHFGGTGDFDGNGKSDIAWVNDNGKVSIWDNGQIGGAHIVANLGSDISGWHFAGTGDFDGNSKSDFLWVNDNGRASIWDNGDVTKAHTIAPVGTISNGWSFADTGDYDGNGQTDILWQNSHGQASIWDNGDIAHAHIVASSLSGLHIV
ncbi:beta strand repeat-containing protein [Bradyrhizobium tropiciagri]|uniref:beta strand repeat-containing protein n=1 Tax=Bradyrhizobium tropiciagri TaxID=312253 RepID=UPI0020134A7F|nr:FG-GAP-like repeat-containing protein [Bradyrhizobium tropiciagri]